MTASSENSNFPSAFEWPENIQKNDKVKHVQELCIGMEKYLVFALTTVNSDTKQSSETNDCIFVTKQLQNSQCFEKPEIKDVGFLRRKNIIKILAITKNLKFSSFYIFVLAKGANNYFLYLLDERFETTKFNINKSLFTTDVNAPTEFKIVDFAVSEKIQDINSIPIVFIVKYFFSNQKENSSENYIAYAAFFFSLNEDEVMINNNLADFIWNGKKKSPIFFYPESQINSSGKSDYDERPTLIQFSPPYFIYFRKRMFNITIIKKDAYQTLKLNDQPLYTAFCQFIHQDTALFVFNEIISIINFSKQLNLPVHIFPYGKLRSDTKFYYENDILYIYTQKKIYKVPIYSNQVSDCSHIFSITGNGFNEKPAGFTIACNNFILRFGNDFYVATPKKTGQFAADTLIQNGNVFECISTLENLGVHEDKETRKQAFIDCFVELWKKDHKEEALIIACNPHSRVKLSSVITLFEIFNEQATIHEFKNLSIISATFFKKEDHLEVYKRLRFYIDQCRQRYKDKGKLIDLSIANAYIIMYLSFFHKRKELIDFLKQERTNILIKEPSAFLKVEEFFNKFKNQCKLNVEEAIFYAEIGPDSTKSLKLLKELNDKPNYVKGDDNYEFSPTMEAIKILKKEKKISIKNADYKWIFNPPSLEQQIGIYYFLPSEEDYEAESIDSQYLKNLRQTDLSQSGFIFANWECKYYIEWLRCKGLKNDVRLDYAIRLFKKLKETQNNISKDLTNAHNFLVQHKEEVIWIDSIRKYYKKKVFRENSGNDLKGDLNPNSALEEAIKDIQEIIREVINIMKKNPKEFEKFKEDNCVDALIDIQDIDFKKYLKWLIEDYKVAIELESEGTTSEGQIIKKCKQAQNPSKAFECFDEGRKDILEKKTTNDKYEWEEKIEFIALDDFINKLPDSTTLNVAAPFLSSAISLMTSRIHNLEQRISIQKQNIAEEKMIAAYDQIFKKVESQTHSLNMD